MKKIILGITFLAGILVLNASAYTDVYTINAKMVEGYKAELRECFDFLRKQPSSNKYFRYQFKNYISSDPMGRIGDASFNESQLKYLLQGGYGPVKGEEAKDIYTDASEMMVAGAIIATGLKYGLEKVLFNKEENTSTDKKLSKIKYAQNMRDLLVFADTKYQYSCNDKKVLIDEEILDYFEKLIKQIPYQFFFNGSIDAYKGGRIVFNTKPLELIVEGTYIFSQDSYMGYSLDKSNNFTKNKEK